jgi:hypothetical protein
MPFLNIPVQMEPNGNRRNILIGFDGNHDLRVPVEAGDVDFLIISAELGFTPLVANQEFISESLGIEGQTILRVADAIQTDRNNASMVLMESKNPASSLRGVILVSSENSEYYTRRLKEDRDPRRKREFYFSLTLESIVLARNNQKPRKIGMTHISAGGVVPAEILAPSIEAYIKLKIESNRNMGRFSFVGCCIEQNQIEEGARMIDLDDLGWHRPRAHFAEDEISGFRRINAHIL